MAEQNSVMTRTPRHLDQADWFHVYNRGADRQDVFSLDGDRALFESLIADAIEATGIEVHAFALMTNHFHLLIYATDDRLSLFMHHLCSRYAAAYNQRTGRTGPLFGGRFGHVPITDDDHLVVEARYIERNPLSFVPRAALANYRHSSLGVYIGRRPAPRWLSTYMLSGLFEPSEYFDFVMAEHPTDLEPHVFVDSAAGVTVADLIESVRLVSSIDPVKRSGPERNIALAIATQFRLGSSTELATEFGMSAAGVRQAARRGRIGIATDVQSEALHDRVLRSVRRAA
jgi:putative transposase